MESVEVWMWIIAGLIIGGIVFSGAYVFLSRYMAQQEVSQARESFNRLKYSVNTVCIGGSLDKEVDQYIFPYNVEKIYVIDEEGIEGEGNQLCMRIKDEESSCAKINLCTLKMSTLDLGEKTSIFYLIQKALGKKMVANIEFSIEKHDVKNIDINWTRKYVK